MRSEPRVVPVEEASAPLAIPATHDTLEVLFGSLDDGVTVQGPGGLVYANAAAVRAMGFSSREAFAAAPPDEVASRWRLFDEAGRPLSFDELPGRAVLNGGEARERVVRFVAREGHEERWARVKATPLRDASGRVAAALNVIQDVTAARREQARRDVLHMVTTLVADATTPGDATPRLLATLGAGLGWDAGFLWRVEASTLRCEGSWRAEHAALGRFEAATRGLRLREGEGLPGRVLQTGRAAWVSDFAAEPTLPRQQHAADVELHAAVAFPVRSAGRVVAVLEFFARAVRPADDAMLHVLEAAGGQLGLFLERAAAEDALRDTNARRGAILDSSLDCIVSMDATGRVVEWNAAAERTFGYARGEALGRDMADLIVPAHLRDAHRKGLARYVASGSPRVLGQRLELPAQRRDGSTFPAELAITRVPTAGPPLFTGFLRDITTQKQQEEQLRLQKSLLEAQMEASLDGILLVDLRGRILSWNRRFAQMWGIPDEVLAARDVEACRAIAASRVVDVDAFLEGRRYYEERAEITCRDEVRLKDGRVLDQHGAPIRLEGGAVLGRVWAYRDVTEMKQLLAEVEAQRARLDNIVRSVPGVVWEAWGEPDAAQQRMNFVSEHVHAMLGYTVEEWLATPNFWLTIVHPDDRESAAKGARAKYDERRAGAQEFRWVAKDGRVLWVQAHSAPILDASGKPVGMRGVTLDITRRKQAEDAMARLAAIVQGSEDAIYAKSLDGRIVEWNPGAERLYGYSRDQILGKPIQTVVPADRVEEEQQILARIASGERVPPLETERLRKDGTRFPVSLTVSPIHDAHGKIVGASAIVRDISRERAAQRALEESEARSRFLADSVPEQVWTTRADGKLEYVNRRIVDYFGRSAETMLEKGWAELVHPDDVQAAGEAFRACLASGEPYAAEFRLRRADGAYRWHLARALPQRDGAGRVRRWFGANSDIEDVKRAEADLKERADELARIAAKLERSNKELDQFAYVTSHDLKAPLRGIANLSRWIEEDMGGEVPAPVRGHLEMLRGRVHRMEALIDAILEYSRVGRVRAKAEPVDTRQLVLDTADLLAPPPGVKVHADESLPVVEAERLRLQQVLMNLIGNAIKHHHRKDDANVRVRARDERTRWRFEVQDDGPGIAPRFHEKVFVIFQTLEARDKVEGTGIGLALVKKIVESQGGQVGIESDEGRGATFWFTWPKTKGRDS